jgi:hypothetical protein
MQCKDYKIPVAASTGFFNARMKRRKCVMQFILIVLAVQFFIKLIEKAFKNNQVEKGGSKHSP